MSLTNTSSSGMVSIKFCFSSVTRLYFPGVFGYILYFLLLLLRTAHSEYYGLITLEHYFSHSLEIADFSY